MKDLYLLGIGGRNLRPPKPMWYRIRDSPKHPFHVASQRKKSVSPNASSKPRTSPLPGTKDKFKRAMD